MISDRFDTAKPEIQRVLRRLMAQFQQTLPAGSFGDIERVALTLANELVRGVLEQDLRDIADSFGDFVEYRGQTYRRHLRGSEKYYSLCGPIEVARYTYRLIGVHNGPTILPLELEAGLIEDAAPELTLNVAHWYGENHMLARLELLRKAHRPPPPRATLERLAKRLAAAVATETPQTEPKVLRLQRVPQEAGSVVVGVDRTSTPMAEQSDKQSKPRTKPHVRKRPAPVDVNYRMVYVATVTLVDRHGEAKVSRRYATDASACEHNSIDHVMTDVRHYVTQRPDLLMGVVQDGAHEMWNLVRPKLKKLKQVRDTDTWSEAIDFGHLLWAVARKQRNEAFALLRTFHRQRLQWGRRSKATEWPCLALQINSEEASMGPSLESNGMTERPRFLGRAASRLQWGRRSKATECWRWLGG